MFKLKLYTMNKKKLNVMSKNDNYANNKQFKLPSSTLPSY